MSDRDRHTRFAILVLFGINFMNFFDRQIAGALGEPIRIEFGLNDTQLGLLATVFTLVYAVVGVPIGRLTDTWSRKRLIALGVTFWSLLTAASGVAWNYTSFLLTRIGVGIGEASCAPASQSLIGDLYPPERRARAMAIFMLGLPLGLFGAYLLAGVIGEAWGWRAAFLVACVPGLVLAGLVLLIREPARGGTEVYAVAAVEPVRAPYRTVMRIRTLWWIVVSGMLFNFNTYAVNTFQTPFLQRFHELGLRDANNLSAVSLGLAGAVGLLLGGWLGDRLRRQYANGRLVLAAVTMGLGAPCVYVALQQPAGQVGTFTVLMATSTALTYVYFSTVYTAIQDVVEPRLRGTAVALYFFAMYVLGASFGSTVMGALSDFFAQRAMLAAGATEMLAPFRALGLRSAMHSIPVLMLLCAVALMCASTTVAADMRRLQAKMNAPGSGPP